MIKKQPKIIFKKLSNIDPKLTNIWPNIDHKMTKNIVRVCTNVRLITNIKIRSQSLCDKSWQQIQQVEKWIVHSHRANQETQVR